MKFLKNIKNALILCGISFVLCGLIYPFLMTGLSKVIFPSQANGSLVEYQGAPVGAKNVGQAFTDKKFFHGRPSAVNYNTYEVGEKNLRPASGSENLAPSNPKLKKRVEKDLAKFLIENPSISKKDVPIDLLTESGSGLDPHISLEGAKVQIDRVAKNSGLSEEKVKKLVLENTEEKILGIFGQERVNVLELNLDLVKEMEKGK
jgi:K+-transporting ATPase ATPase C chain